MELDCKIEGVLFYKAAPVKKTTLAKMLSETTEAIDAALLVLQKRLESTGVRLVVTDADAVLTTAPELAELIETLRKEELKKDIGKAGAETLAIIVYRGPLSRAEIDRIRGVNSAFILRNLLVRGLIERRAHPKDARAFHYAATPELFAHLGITKREDMPEFAATMNALDAFEAGEKEAEKDAGIDTEQTE